MNIDSLFAYGILRDRGTLERTIGRRFEGVMVPAVLPGYQVLDTSPRYVIPDDSKGVEGILIRGLRTHDFAPLDRLEGTRWGHYIRVEAKAHIGGNTLIRTDGEEMHLGFPKTEDGAVQIDRMVAVPCYVYVAGLQGCYGIIRSTLANMERRIKEMEAAK